MMSQRRQGGGVRGHGGSGGKTPPRSPPYAPTRVLAAPGKLERDLYDLLGGFRCLPTPAHWLHEQGRSDLTADVVEARAQRLIADALAHATTSGAL